ncbi:hypothetical protein CTEN210_00456 [Chaetoceros tenuissimus]|uniref:Uncharacterized protein n=1 Tax=Chaetoceros tenuissimus TaxID=426638 RepID=A0AAD3GYE8_9STRA|nr:hypothetical protein CTEN210_00456 [Chaetoceros tenuissimus]
MSSSKPTTSTASTASRTARYQATKNESSLSIHDLDIENLNIEQLSQEMNQKAKDATPFTKDEIEEIIRSFENVMPDNCGISLDALKELIEAVAHLSHKDWSKTEQSAKTLNDILLKGDTSGELSPEFKQIFSRVIQEGNWNGASDYASSRKEGKPWAILVTGVNGIRKTTSVYQPWFQPLLSEALVHPSNQDVDSVDIPLDTLPTGENSFFRQLDHMIITLINHNFQKLYAMTDLSHDFDSEKEPPSSIIQQYSNYKAAIFSRYRTLSEILGVLLVKQARASSLNIMVETSGRDVAMFHYVDSFFPSEEYNKLALHFTINDLSHAETSVDKRMVREMKEGIEALQSGNVDQVIKANAGGPYGSEVLKGIQRDSDAVWDTIISEGDSDVGKDWYKASININASADEDWTAFATKPDGTDGTVFTFEAPRKV